MSFLLHTAWQRFNRWSNFAEEKTLFSPNKFCGSTRDSVSQCDVINWSPSFSFSQFRSCPPKEIRADHAILRLGSRLYLLDRTRQYFHSMAPPFFNLYWELQQKSLLKRLLLNPISRIFQCQNNFPLKCPAPTFIEPNFKMVRSEVCNSWCFCLESQIQHLHQHKDKK